MKISLKWLKDYVEVDDFLINPEPLAKALTSAGLEVEELVEESKNYDHVVVGFIEKLVPHADRLTYCDVRVSENEVLKIVCGAKNHKEGDKVCVAKVGAVLPGDFKIRKSKIRGLESCGMLCSKKELALGEEDKGILILSKEAKVGESFARHFDKNDVVLEVNVTPNRADCLSHLGLAREVSVLFNRPLKKREIKRITKEQKRAIQIDLKDPLQCPRYRACMIYDVKVKKSPAWLKKRLERVGLSSINNVVDITNYIMMDTGQPLHAFDSAVISGERVIIRKANKAESFKSLDGTEYKLTGGELVIADKDKVLALAGIVGGENSGVREGTKSVFLEAAYFTPESVRKTSRALGIDTDSAHRFSRGVDQFSTDKAMDYALFLLQDTGDVSEKIYEAYPKPYRPVEISVTLDFLNKKLGLSLEAKKIEEIFSQLDFEVKSVKEGEWRIKPKAFRHDIGIKEDLAEEVGRLLGYDQIPEILPAVVTQPQKKLPLYENFLKLKNHCVGLGFKEVIHHNFYGSHDEMQWHKEIKKNGLLSMGDEVRIKNPLSQESSLMRETLIPQFFSNCVKNQRLGRAEGRIFEFGKAHYKLSEFKESHVLSLGLWSKSLTQGELHKELMGSLRKLLSLWSIKNFRFIEKSLDSKVLHPKLTAILQLEGKKAGLIYAAHPYLVKQQKLAVHYSGLEIDLDILLKGQPRPRKFKEFSRQPIVERDFSFVIDESFDFVRIEKEVKGLKHFKGLMLVDEYQDEKLGESKVLLRASFQAQDKTLSEDEIKELHANVLEKFKGVMDVN